MSLQVAAINASGLGDNIVIASSPGASIQVYKIWWIATGVVSAKHRHGTTDFHPAIPMLANGAFVLDYDGTPWFATLYGEPFVLNLTGAVQVAGMVYFRVTP